MVGVVVGSAAFWSEMMLLEIEQLSSDLEAGEVEEVPNRLQLDLLEGTMKADERIVEYIIGRLPSPEAWVATKHPSGEFEEPVASVIQQQGSRPLIARLGEVYQPLKLGIGSDGHRDAFLGRARD